MITQQLEIPAWGTLVCQESSMTPENRNEFMAGFYEHKEKCQIGAVVLGGIFSEGIDLPGDACIGVVIVGVALPGIDGRRERVKDYFERFGFDGFDLVYRVPGIMKVIQAAGRLIRTPEDRGVTLLVGDRFGHPDYSRYLPLEWHLVPVVSPGQIRMRIDRFYNATPEIDLKSHATFKNLDSYSNL